MVGATKMIADGRKVTTGLGSEGDLGGFARLNFLVEFKRTHEETVGDIFTVQAELDGPAFFQRDVIGGKAKASGCDLNDGRGVRRSRTGLKCRDRRNEQCCQREKGEL